jgi:predicted nucleic acid-binding protein
MKQVLDASSLLTLIETHGTKAAKHLANSITIPLIYYEIGNALKTSATHLKHITPTEAKTTLKNLHKALELVEITHMENNQDSELILENSLEYGLTYYDSAYLTAAQKQSATLVTEDKRLANAATMAGIKTQQASSLKPN